MRLLVHTALFVVTLTLSSAGGRGRGRIFDPKTFDTIDDQPDDDGERDKRLLNIFQVVRFPNSACNTTAGDQGVCYTAAECTSRSGSNSGSCASGFGVCCSFSIGCGGMTSQNNTYFVSSSEDTSPCSVTICKCDSDICQLRMDFTKFEIALPNDDAVTQNSPQSSTQCLDATFTASSDGTGPPVICGTNTGYHMIVEADDACNTLAFAWTKDSPRSWKIKVSQISCKDPHKPPEGCTQYVTGVTGNIQSYNFIGGVHIASQNYINCIRTELGYCTIRWSTPPNSFRLTRAADSVGDSCTSDYVIIVGGYSADHNKDSDRYCGSDLKTPDTGNPPGTIISTRKPFSLQFVTNAGEVTPTDRNRLGFSLDFKQVAC